MTEPREHATLREDVRSWLASNPTPSADFEVPQTAMTVADEAPLEYLRSWQARLYDAGFVGVEWPEAYGGRDLGRGAQGIVDQELAAANTPPLLNIVALNWAGPIILRHGTDDQKRRYLAPLLRCDEIWCQGFSEPGAGSDLASLQTRAVREGDGYRIDGEKVWTTLGRFADQMILLARTNPDEARHAGISYFLAPMRVPGVSVHPLLKLTGELGFNRVEFDGAMIPADTLLGREGEGWKLAMETLQFERGAAEGGAGRSRLEQWHARGLDRDGEAVPARRAPGARRRGHPRSHRCTGHRSHGVPRLARKAARTGPEPRPAHGPSDDHQARR